jgi:acetyltransferase-like isoleucine patch superfamily enzyme
MSHIKLAKSSIENFSLKEDNYLTSFGINGVKANGNGKIFIRKSDENGMNILTKVKEIGKWLLGRKRKIHVDFGSTKGCRVFLGTNVKGNFTVFFRGNNSLLYIGSDCSLNNVQFRSFQNEDFIAIGNQVTTTSTNVWISGNGAGKANPAIIIGDDCMFSYDVVIRNSDAHPICSVSTGEQVNEPKGVVHIEPHVWIGEGASILKSVTVGACSILSLGSIITKDVPRFSIASGVPATSRIKSDIYWARGNSLQAKDRAMHFVNKYKTP